MVRMWVDRARFRPYPASVQRLLAVESGELNRLYQLGFASWLPSTAIADGVYYGMRVNGQLIAAAGTHVVSSSARLAVVGRDFVRICRPQCFRHDLAIVGVGTGAKPAAALAFTAGCAISLRRVTGERLRNHAHEIKFADALAAMEEQRMRQPLPALQDVAPLRLMPGIDRYRHKAPARRASSTRIFSTLKPASMTRMRDGASAARCR